MWTYQQANGILTAEDGLTSFQGYSGHGLGKDNPGMQAIPDVGPLPCGMWSIEGPPFESPSHGPYVMRLVPDIATNTFTRSGFLLHGDSKENPGQASLGCLVFPRNVRQRVWESGDHRLLVVSGLSNNAEQVQDAAADAN